MCRLCLCVHTSSHIHLSTEGSLVSPSEGKNAGVILSLSRDGLQVCTPSVQS